MTGEVVFRFGESSEVRYVDRMPECGERFTRGDTTWEVVAVETPGEGRTTCVLMPVSWDARTVVNDLMERVQEFELDQIAWNLPRRPRAT